MFIVADAHVSRAQDNHEPFFEMLDALRDTGEDVVFLGDIFDLWVSLPRYEGPLQRRFLEWCAAYKQSASVGYIEGNREFYMVRRNRNCFTWSDGAKHLEGNILFVHGDLINRADKKYLRFRRLSKNALVRNAVRFLPYGPKFAHNMKLKLKQTNHAFRLGLPVEALESFARARFAEGVTCILVGHFHEPYLFEENGAALHVLPDWFTDHHVGYLDRTNGVLETGPWRQLIARREGAGADETST
ncbi:MAG: metallophosphoesterase [Acidobacteriota bacterium]|nr:metallophosphoesterase [Acidobacteriota bacterium]